MKMTTEHTLLKNICKYDENVTCFTVGECAFPTVKECLRQALYLAQREVAELKAKTATKHNALSLKWRTSSFYYKRKSQELEDILKEVGVKVKVESDGHVKVL